MERNIFIAAIVALVAIVIVAMVVVPPLVMQVDDTGNVLEVENRELRVTSSEWQGKYNESREENERLKLANEQIRINISAERNSSYNIANITTEIYKLESENRNLTEKNVELRDSMKSSKSSILEEIGETEIGKWYMYDDKILLAKDRAIVKQDIGHGLYIHLEIRSEDGVAKLYIYKYNTYSDHYEDIYQCSGTECLDTRDIRVRG